MYDESSRPNRGDTHQHHVEEQAAMNFAGFSSFGFGFSYRKGNNMSFEKTFARWILVALSALLL
ncbi:MAG: hypothetical protein LBI62_01195, partial [Candidatus Accumulibacter sp.]|nr:hypothetical protein [Accumulibacter sp.]